jgi:hypothetical protein
MLMRMLGTALGVVLTMAAVGHVAAAQGAKTDVSGTWTFEVQTDAGSGTPTVTFKQDGEKLAGHYSSATLGEADLTGTVKGAEIAFAFTANVQGTSLPVTYAGTVDSATTMKGTLTITGVGNGTFTGKKG